MINDFKFQESEFQNQGVSDLPTRPNEAGMAESELKARFDNIAKVMIALGRLNDFFDYLASEEASSDIGAIPVKDGGGNKLQTILSEIQAENASNTSARHTHANKAILDSLDSLTINELGRLIEMFGGTTNVSTTVENTDTEIPTSKAVLNAMAAGGAGDMLKAVYDTDGDGKVDMANNSEMLGGKYPAQYADQEDLMSIEETLSGKADKSVTTPITLLSTSWDGNGQTVSVPGWSPASKGVIGLTSGFTSEQADAYAKGKITYSEDANSITFTSEGTVPGVDINLTLLEVK